MIERWVGKILLEHGAPWALNEIGFLSAIPPESPAVDEPEEPTGEDVGRIDQVLVVPDSLPRVWCALEVQAVYFQGPGMSEEFEAIRRHEGDRLPFPVNNRRPDYRSSGPKRLMPQLQIKVPALRGRGKKMAVVVDQDFFAALAPMEEVQDVSNCDIAWFVVRYDESGERARLVPDQVHLTTLERAVEGLTAGRPVSLEVFEERIREKVAKMIAKP